jgi:hypothetical protein
MTWDYEHTWLKVRSYIYIYIYIYDMDGNSSHFSTLRTRTEMVLETLVFLPFNHLTRLVTRENFIIHSRCETSRSYISVFILLRTFRVSLNYLGLVCKD